MLLPKSEWGRAWTAAVVLLLAVLLFTALACGASLGFHRLDAWIVLHGLAALFWTVITLGLMKEQTEDRERKTYHLALLASAVIGVFPTVGFMALLSLFDTGTDFHSFSRHLLAIDLLKAGYEGLVVYYTCTVTAFRFVGTLVLYPEQIKNDARAVLRLRAFIELILGLLLLALAAWTLIREGVWAIGGWARVVVSVALLTIARARLLPQGDSQQEASSEF